MASLSIPHSFTNNTVASATEVNQNFLSVKSFAEAAVVQVDGSIQAPTVAIANLAVTTAKIADLNVTTGKIADLNVTTGKITDLNVTTGKIADLNVTTGKIADLNVTTGKIAASAITKEKIGSGPRGIVAYGSTTTSDTTITTEEIQITCSTFTAVAGRYYRITYYEPVLVIPNGAHMQASISGYLQPVIETALIQNPRSSGDHYQFMNLSLVTTLPAGSTVMRGVLVTNSGTGQASRTSERPAWMSVEDIGTI